MLLVDLALSSLWWFMTLHKGRWTEKKKGEILQQNYWAFPPAQMREIFVKKKRSWGISVPLLLLKGFSLFNKSRFDSTNWIKKKARGKNCVKRNSLRLSIFELFLPWDDNFHLVFRYSPSLLLAFTAAAELTFHLWFWIKLSSLKSQQYCAVRENHLNCLIIIFFDFWLINLCQNTPRWPK